MENTGENLSQIVENSKVNWNILNGIVSDFYSLTEGFKRVYDITYPWNDICKHYADSLSKSSTAILKQTRLIFEDLSTLNEDLRSVLNEVFENEVNACSFNLLCCQVKKIALVLLNENAINLDTYLHLIKLKKDKLIKRYENNNDRPFVKLLEKDSAKIFLRRFIDYLKDNFPDLMKYGRFMFLKYHLSNLGLRISSINDIKNYQIGDNHLLFRVFKKKNINGYDWHNYQWGFIGYEFQEWFRAYRDLSNPNELFFTSAPEKLGGVMEKFRKYIKDKRYRNEVLEGWKQYSKWKRNTHSGRHGFILECHAKGLSDTQISDFTLQSEAIIRNNYTQKMAKEMRKADSMMKFMNMDGEYRKRIEGLEIGLLSST